MLNNKINLIDEIKSDLYRYEGRYSLGLFIKSFVFSHTGFRISTLYRINHSLHRNGKYKLAKIFSLIYRLISKLYGVDIPYYTIIDKGIYMPHPFTIIINGECVIGKNCNLHQCVTIGEAGRGEKKGNPIICNNVYIGPGAKVFGRIKVKDNCAIGANCVLNRTTEINEVVAGVPAKKISTKGSLDFYKNIYSK